MQHEQAGTSTVNTYHESGEEVMYWTHERMSELFLWLMGPEYDDHWEALRGTKAAKTSCFQSCASQVFHGERTYQSLQGCYQRNFNIFKQIHAAFQASDPVLPVIVTERLSLYEQLLKNARASGYSIWEAVTPDTIETWHQKGWYKTFYQRWHGDPAVILPTSSGTVVANQNESLAIHQDRFRHSVTPSLISRLQEVFADIPLYRRLLECQQETAQKMLNLFQGILDTPQLDASFRRNLIVATQRISTKTGLYPTCYELKDVTLEGEHAVAAGGFADVFKGIFEGQAVCLKAIRIYRNTELHDFLKRFSKEAILWGQLSHPNILPIYGLFRFQNRICLVSPWMEAGDITTYLQQHPEAPRMELAVDVVRGLSYLHKNGIIHGDLKGPNILINYAGRACLADFGISSITDSEILAWTSHSSAASKGGSARWQAPELLDVETDDLIKNTRASDIYACACVFYEIFVGTIPFAGVFREPAVIAKIQSGARPSRPPDSSPAWRNWGLTEDIWSLMKKCWQTFPTERPGIDQVCSTLIAKLDRDSRASASGTVWSPAHFRKRMHESPNMTSSSDLDALLSLSIDKNPDVDNNVTDVALDIAVGLDLHPETSFGIDESSPTDPGPMIQPLMPDGWNNFIKSILPSKQARSDSNSSTDTAVQSERRSFSTNKLEFEDDSLGSFQDLYDPYYEPPLMHCDFPLMPLDVPRLTSTPSSEAQPIKKRSRSPVLRGTASSSQPNKRTRF